MLIAHINKIIGKGKSVNNFAKQLLKVKMSYSIRKRAKLVYVNYMTVFMNMSGK